VNLENFKNLNRVCEDLLRQNLSRPEGLAFSALHLLGPHPSQLEKYEFPQRENFIQSWKYSGWRLFQRAAGLLAPKNISVLWKKYNLKRIDHIIISHEVGGPNLKQDFYFGQIPKSLEKLGKKVLILKINHLGLKSKLRALVPAKNSKNIFSIALPEWTSWKIENEISRIIPSAYKKIEKDIHTKNKYGPIVKGALSRKSEELSAAFNLRLYFFMRAILKEMRPSTLHFTWEGHAWERLAIRAAREVSPRAICVGYQHTVLFPNAIGPFRSLGKLHDPDEIWTVGRQNYKRLTSAWASRGVRISIYGSPRHRRFPLREATKKKPLCIVAPEGFMSEASRLFLFGKEVAKRFPAIQFRFRSHPILPFGAVAKRNPSLSQLPSNVEISDQAKPNDLTQARWFIYRGTSLVFEALAAGAKPLYVGKKNELSIDPLEKLKKWKRVLGRPQEAKQVFKKDLLPHPKKTWQELRMAKKWGADYFMKEKPQLAAGRRKKRK